eukprot:5390332-Heterocapsa_arctica.AAC.1
MPRVHCAPSQRPRKTHPWRRMCAPARAPARLVMPSMPRQSPANGPAPYLAPPGMRRPDDAC